MGAYIRNSHVAVSHSQRARKLHSNSSKAVTPIPRYPGRPLLTALLAISLGACGGGGSGYGNNGDSDTSAPPPPQNSVPTANAGADTDVTEGQTATLSGSGSDPDGDPISYEWTQFAGDTVTLSDARASSTTFTAPATDVDLDLGFRLTVRDVNGGTATDDVIIHVANDDPPVADAGANQTVDEQSLVALDGTASFDPDGDATTYEWTQVAGAAARLDDATSASPGFT
ncbi:MAG: hypothetical protein KJO31_12865, partial [Gammaproteobacteria bacterium]|nr:hypothetical protein [Gammaproteobacteria bacterium]